MPLLRSSFPSPLGEIEVFSSASRIAYIGFKGQALPTWLMKGATEGHDGAIDKAISYLQDYFDGAKPVIDFPICPARTSFQEAVRAELLSLPYGETVSYAELTRRVERRVGRKSFVRAVAKAVSLNPVLIAIPCHRVILSSGGIGGYAGSVERKKRLLEFEKRVLVSGAKPAK